MTALLNPKVVLYCGVCSLPLEYCSYTLNPKKCQQWLEQNHSELIPLFYPSSVDNTTIAVSQINLDESIMAKDEGVDDDAEEKKRQTRGGKSIIKDESKKLEKEEAKRKKAKVIIKLVERNKRKRVTHIRGMELFGLDLKKIAKRCASKYACGCSVTRNPAGYDEVVIQGDFVDDLFEFIPTEWPEISEEQIEVSEK